MDLLRLFVIAVTPGIALAMGLYLTDRYDREPVRLLLKLFLLECCLQFQQFCGKVFKQYQFSSRNSVHSVDNIHCCRVHRRVFQASCCHAGSLLS